MARIVEIPVNMSLRAALGYFSGELPKKETAWIELLGTASKVETTPGRFLANSQTLNLTQFVCVLSNGKRTTNGTISDANGQIVYSGPLHDFIADSIHGRLTMIPKTPWKPPKETVSEPVPTSAKDTVSLETPPVSWGDLTQLSEEKAVAPPQSSRKKKAGAVTPNPTPETFAVGDVMMHPRFGRCKIVRAPAFGKVKVRKPSGAFSDLHLKVIQIVQIERTQTNRIFHVQIGPA